MEPVPVPNIPHPLDQIGNRPFSFYPPILGLEHNDWLFSRATWSEILVINTKSGAEIWVPRRFIGEISRVDEPVMIVGLKKELEFKGGTLWPHERRIIEMPRAVNEGPRPPAPGEAPAPAPRPAPVVGIRLDDGAESKIGRLMLAIISIGIVLCVLVVTLIRGRSDGSRVEFTPVMQSDLPFTARDDVYRVIARLGQPAEDRWKSEEGEVQYRRLWYPNLGLYMIFMGSDRNASSYIGALDKNWKVVHAVEMPGGKSSANLLSKLQKF